LKLKSNRTDLPQDWADALEVIEKGARRTLLYGPPGTGKTFAGRHAGSPKKVYNIYVSEESPAYDVIGHDIVVGGEMVWRDGPAVLAWRNGGRLVINEIDKASGDCLDALLAILDDPESCGYVLPTGEYVEPKAGFTAVATMNGDPNDLPDALKDRFTIRVHIENPHPDAILALSEDLRATAKATTGAKVEKNRRLSIRQFRAYDELRGLGVDEAIAGRAAFHHRAADLVGALSVATMKK
jgi:MoxR-like ATPase